MTRPRIATTQLIEAASNRPLEPNAAGSSTPPAPLAPAPTVGWANTTLVGCGPVLGLKIPWSGGGVSVAAAGLVAVALGFGPVVAGGAGARGAGPRPRARAGAGGGGGAGAVVWGGRRGVRHRRV